jgi:hypothetical protein
MVLDGGKRVSPSQLPLIGGNILSAGSRRTVRRRWPGAVRLSTGGFMTKKQRTGTAPERQKETAPQTQTQSQSQQSQGPSQSGTGQPFDRDPEEEGSAGREPDAREEE